MAGYNAYDDDFDDMDMSPKGPGRFIPWLLSFVLIGLAAYQGAELYRVAYGGVPGDFLGDGPNQVLADEAIVNEVAARVFAAPDETSPVLFAAKAGTRVRLIGRHADFVKISLPKGQTGYLKSDAVTPGFLFIENPSERERHERSYFPQRFTYINKSLWEGRGAGRSVLSIDIGNYSGVALESVDVRVFFQDEMGNTIETFDVKLEGRIEANSKRGWKNISIRLPSNRRYKTSELEILSVTPALD